MEQTSPNKIDVKSRLDTLEPNSSRILLVFQLADHWAALSLKEVERIVPMAELARPPGLPLALEGVLNLAGNATPVLRLDRLFKLAPQKLDLYSLLVILRGPDQGRFAITVDRVSQIAQVSESALLPIEPEDSFNGCAEATVTIDNQVVHVLSPTRILLAKERDSLSEFQTMAQQRLQQWRGGQA